MDPAAASCCAAQPNSAGLGSTVPGPCLRLSVGGFSRDTRGFLHLWLSQIEKVKYETTVQRQQECGSEMQKRQKGSRKVFTWSQPSASAQDEA